MNPNTTKQNNMKPKPNTTRRRRLGAPKIIKPREFKVLLQKATPQTLPAFILAGFCGLRLAEIQNLDWQDVDFESRVVMVVGGKYPSQKRLVSLPDAATAWLRPIAKESGRVIDSPSLSTLSAQMHPVWKEAKCAATPHSLRYSAISYRLAIDGETQTAAEFGFSIMMLIVLFRKLVSKQRAKKWFSIFPLVRS
jgi:integrase